MPFVPMSVPPPKAVACQLWPELPVTQVAEGFHTHGRNGHKAYISPNIGWNPTPGVIFFFFPIPSLLSFFFK